MPCRQQWTRGFGWTVAADVSPDRKPVQINQNISVSEVVHRPFTKQRFYEGVHRFDDHAYPIPPCLDHQARAKLEQL